MAKTLLTSTARLVAIGAAMTSSAEAGGGYGRHRSPVLHPGGYVVAESRFGHGTVSGPIRPARHGFEVRMPGGTWIACGRSCAETLRVETVDFWENRGAGRDRIDNECGLVGCLTRTFRF
jgi:hypothetical protein